MVVTYFPDWGIPDRLALLLRQFAAVIVIDNGTDGEQGELVKKLGIESGITVLSNNDNRGLAAALNQGVTLARKQGFRWCVTFDQDTEILAGLLPTLLAVLDELGNERVLVGANYWHVHARRPFLTCGCGRRWVSRKTVITSGTLMQTDILERIGGFREDYFIDSVDHEFCLRARRYGYAVAITCEPLMRQRIGQGTEHKSVWTRLGAFQHNANRKYFMARNIVMTVRSYFTNEPAWCLRQCMRLIGEFVLLSLFEDGRPEKIRAFLAGMKAGITGTMDADGQPTQWR